jgi:hypothetical protein
MTNAKSQQPAAEASPGAPAVAARAQPVSGVIADESIRMRAYQLYRERGIPGGDAMNDWLRAERECRKALHGEGKTQAPTATFSHELAS